VVQKLDIPDLGEKTLVKSFADFSLPTKDEGFDDISFVWQDESACSKFLKDWVLEKKLTQRVEDLQPGEWFREEWSKWQKSLQEWRKRHSDFKDPVKKKALLAKKKADAEKKKENEDKDGEEKEADKEETKPMDINAEDIDVMSVEDVNDIGNGEPVYANFAYEDWVLLSTRFELHLMLHSFRKDLNDSDRPSFLEDHLAFYYNKYFKKAFNVKSFGIEKFSELVDLISDSVGIESDKPFLKAVLAEDTSFAQFMKVTEDHRRERERRVDAGDETAKLKFARPPPPPRQPNPPPPRQSTMNSGGHSGNRESSRYGGGSGGRPGYSSSSYGNSQNSAHKRPYQHQQTSSYGSSKQPRVGSYSSSHGSGSYYRR